MTAPSPETPKGRLAADFPEAFMWGAATASYQVEGSVGVGGRGQTIWDTFSHTEGKTFNGETGDLAADHYNRYVEDVRILSELGVDAYRFSIAWSRILPDGTGRVNGEGIDFYVRLCKELEAAGITPVATLYHWDLPQALEDRGGWRNPDSVGWFTEYAEVAYRHLGGFIPHLATFNEPWCTAFLGHSAGEHAPGMRDPGTAFVVAHHLMLAHHSALAQMRSMGGDTKLGVVLNLIPAEGVSERPEDVDAADSIDAIQNRLFLDAVFHGHYPEKVIRYQERFGVSSLIDLDALARAAVPPDVLGVNYYNINHVAHLEGAPYMAAWPGADEAVIVRPPGELTDMGWGVEPRGLTVALERAHRDYGPIPIMVTENGAAYPDIVASDGMVHDRERTEYLRTHIDAVGDAIDSGVDVAGYFVWSLLDNFEWARGYSKRFGVIRVDYDTMERTFKDSGRWYRAFLTGGRAG